MGQWIHNLQNLGLISWPVDLYFTKLGCVYSVLLLYSFVHCAFAKFASLLKVINVSKISCFMLA